MNDEATIEAGRILRLVESAAAVEPDALPSWPCPDCGETMAGGCVPESMEARLCYDCVGDPRNFIPAGERSRLPRRFASREAALEAHGVPVGHRIPFVEPAEWPHDGRRSGMDLSKWAGDPWCVLLAGVVKGGKTMLATELFWRRLPWVHTAYWIRCGTAITALFGTFGEEKANDMARKLYDSDLLVMDEIGRGHDGKAWNAIVEVVSHRHENQLATIFTTNRRLKRKPADKEPGLAEEDPALFRRIEEGFIGGFTKSWGAR